MLKKIASLFGVVFVIVAIIAAIFQDFQGAAWFGSAGVVLILIRGPKNVLPDLRDIFKSEDIE